ncbi:hypothetical protein AKJ63_00865 [candidate division MSBL1 archaeon SCGC-AAA259D18]|uniref:GOLD domain-containing protein n=1 Tax=candidate division MSBL1 archaeon SCGC-AAA259D18 TaxID=1698262 RepID=A0A133UC74_9EURY|nr:hypothetical protein AKJ63_00865 [candidate division MSBL1 archaeon SCGC-AAA259D18]
MKNEKTNDQRIVGSITVILTLILLVLGLDAVFIHGREYHESTDFIPPHSNITLKKDLQRRDKINIQINTLEERPVQLLVKGGGIDYSIKGSRMDFNVSIPTSSHYRFTLSNPEDNHLLVNYDYEIVLMHSFWSGVALSVFAIIMAINTLFRFREEVSKGIKSFLESMRKYLPQIS